jgi:hypothetical protein
LPCSVVLWVKVSITVAPVTRGLPHAVGLICGEALVRGPGPFLGLHGDDFGSAQGSPNSAETDCVAFAVQVFGDGVCAGVEAGAGEFEAEVKDSLPEWFGQSVGAAAGAFRGRREGALAFGKPAFVELVGPRFGDSVLVGDLPVGEALDGDRGDDDVRFRHDTLWVSTMS